MITIWVFMGTRARLPAGVFSTLQSAEDWIRRHKLAGTLSEYPLDIGACEHATENELFTPKKARESTPEFIADFSPRLEHFHYEDGARQ
jgi:hypothetical protein